MAQKTWSPETGEVETPTRYGDGMNLEEGLDPCVAWFQGKQRKGKAEQATEKLRIVLSDVFGSMEQTYWSGAHFCVTPTGGLTRKKSICF
jgi:hypothetical protein